MDIAELYKIFTDSKGICIDSRKDVKDKIFFALPGENFNGNKFAGAAVKNGALAAVIDDKEYAKDDRFVLVENTLETLQELAVFHRKTFNIPFIGITGTNGKTTTKELVGGVLNSTYNTYYTKGNLNNHIGVPLTILNIKKDAEIAVIEMGANHPGEIEQLCKIAQPTHGLITNIGKAHLEGFGNFDGVKKTKKELYDYIKKNGELVFVNGDDKLLKELSKGIKKVEYCTGNCIVNGKILKSFPFLTVEINLGKEKIIVSSKLYGSYNLPNILAAAAVGYNFNVKPGNIKKTIESYTPGNNRSQVKVTENNKVIMDAYNANPVSMTKALESFSDAGFEHPCIILGDMFELGNASGEEHKKIVELLKNKGFECVILVGKEFFKVKNGYTAFQTTGETLEYLKKYPVTGKTILLKGSRGMQLETLMPAL